MSIRCWSSAPYPLPCILTGYPSNLYNKAICTAGRREPSIKYQQGTRLTRILELKIGGLQTELILHNNKLSSAAIIISKGVSIFFLGMNAKSTAFIPIKTQSTTGCQFLQQVTSTQVTVCFRPLTTRTCISGYCFTAIHNRLFSIAQLCRDAITQHTLPARPDNPAAASTRTDLISPAE